jgi:hypothetical protein
MCVCGGELVAVVVVMGEWGEVESGFVHEIVTLKQHCLKPDLDC